MRSRSSTLRSSLSRQATCVTPRGSHTTNNCNLWFSSDSLTANCATFRHRAVAAVPIATGKHIRYYCSAASAAPTSEVHSPQTEVPPSTQIPSGNVDEPTEDDPRYQRILVNAETRLAEGSWFDVNKLKLLIESRHFETYAERVLALVEKGFAEQGDPTSAFFHFSLQNYNQLIKGLAERGHMKHAWMIFDKMTQLGKRRYLPDLQTFNGLLEGYRRSNDAKGGLELLVMMKDNHVKPDADTMHSLVALGRPEGLAFRLFDEVKKLNPQVVPLVQTFNVLIDCCVRDKDQAKLMEVREWMDAAGVKESEGTFNGMLKMMKERKDVEGAIQVYTEMRDVEVRPNIATYNLMLKIFASTRDLEKTVAMLSVMEKENMRLNALSYSCLVELNVLREDWDKAGRILKLMKEKGFVVGPETFTSVFEVLLHEMNESQALLVLKFIKQQGVVLETDALVLLLDHFGKHDRLDIFLIELRQFELEGLKHRKDSLHILLRLSVAKENLDLIYLYLQKMKRMGEKVVQDTLNDLKLLLYRQKRTEGIERLFNLVDEVMSAPNAGVYVEEEDKDLPYELEERIRRVARPRKSRKAKEEEAKLRARAAQQVQQQQQQPAQQQQDTTHPATPPQEETPQQQQT